MIYIQKKLIVHIVTHKNELCVLIISNKFKSGEQVSKLRKLFTLVFFDLNNFFVSLCLLVLLGKLYRICVNSARLIFRKDQIKNKDLIINLHFLIFSLTIICRDTPFLLSDLTSSYFKIQNNFIIIIKYKCMRKY